MLEPDPTCRSRPASKRSSPPSARPSRSTPLETVSLNLDYLGTRLRRAYRRVSNRGGNGTVVRLKFETDGRCLRPVRQVQCRSRFRRFARCSFSRAMRFLRAAFCASSLRRAMSFLSSLIAASDVDRPGPAGLFGSTMECTPPSAPSKIGPRECGSKTLGTGAASASQLGAGVRIVRRAADNRKTHCSCLAPRSSSSLHRRPGGVIRNFRQRRRTCPAGGRYATASAKQGKLPISTQSQPSRGIFLNARPPETAPSRSNQQPIHDDDFVADAHRSSGPSSRRDLSEG